MSAMSYLLISAIIHDRGFISRALNSRALRFLGRISYSLYLFHLAALYLVVILVSNFITLGALANFATVLLGGVSSVSLAMISYRLFEIPFIHFGRRASAKLIQAGLMQVRA
jgi:peptidoglycan/LPS O-acetylase OafA/YrhL